MIRLKHAATRAAIVLVPWIAAGCDARLASHLTEDEANEILVALHGAGVDADKEPARGARGEARYDVEVPEGDVGRALSVLAAAELPRREEAGLDAAFGEGGLVPTATEERARFVAALSGELARTLERIDGVVDARVHVAIPERRETLLDDAPPAARASVLVKHRADRPAPDVESIRAIVAGAVQGMDPDSVAVLAMAAEPPPAAPSFEHVGPIAVSSGSAMLLKGVLAASLVLHVLLASLLVVVLRRHRRPGWTGPRSA